MSENINLAVCIDRYNYDCHCNKSVLCSCGYKMNATDEKENDRDRCPECGAPILMINTLHSNIKPGNNQEFQIADSTVKFVSYCSEDGKKITVKNISYKNIKLSVDIKPFSDIYNCYVNKIENYEASEKTLDIDLSRKPVAIITDDKGKEIKATKTAIQRMCSNICADYFDRQFYFKDDGYSYFCNQELYTCRCSGIILESVKSQGTTSLWKGIKFLLDCPAAESLFMTCKNSRELLGLIRNKKATTPYELLEIPKPVYKEICNIDDAWAVKGLTELAQTYCPKIDTGKFILWMQNAKDLLKSQPIRENNSYCRIGTSDLPKLFTLYELGFDPKKIKEYLFDEVYTYQGIESPREALEYLSDYIDMQQNMEVSYERYPHSLKLVHDLAVKNYHVVVNKKQNEFFAKRIRNDDYGRLTYKGENLSIITPEKPEDLVYEGRSLSHCVASYISKVTEGKSKIYFLRKNDEISKPYVTIEVSPDNRLVQCHGFADRNVSTDEANFIKKWCNIKKIAA